MLKKKRLRMKNGKPRRLKRTHIRTQHVCSGHRWDPCMPYDAPVTVEGKDIQFEVDSETTASSSVRRPAGGHGDTSHLV